MQKAVQHRENNLVYSKSSLIKQYKHLIHILEEQSLSHNNNLILKSEAILVRGSQDHAKKVYYTCYKIGE